MRSLEEPDRWSGDFSDFLARALEVDATARASAEKLLEVRCSVSQIA